MTAEGNPDPDRNYPVTVTYAAIPKVHFRTYQAAAEHMMNHGYILGPDSPWAIIPRTY